MMPRAFARSVTVLAALVVSAACAAPQAERFHSAALDRTMHYRIAVPDGSGPFPVVYLLHGYGGGESDWFRYTRADDVARGLGLAVVTPEGGGSWYVNSSAGRWKEYVVRDLIAEIESRWPVRRERGGRAIAGLSMGGYGAMNLALQHPDLFAFAASTGGAFDTTRDTSVFDPRGTDGGVRHIFGAPDSDVRTDNDIYRRINHLDAAADTSALPHLWIDCGLSDPWFGINQEFVDTLKARAVTHEFHALPGDHDWPYWDQQIARILNAAAQRLR